MTCKDLDPEWTLKVGYTRKIHSLKLTWPLKMDGWKITFLLGFGNFSGANCETSEGYHDKTLHKLGGFTGLIHVFFGGGLGHYGGQPLYIHEKTWICNSHDDSRWFTYIHGDSFDSRSISVFVYIIEVSTTQLAMASMCWLRFPRKHVAPSSLTISDEFWL